MPLALRPLAGLAVVGAAALIAGCGGGSGAPSADEFRAQADQICADADARLATLTRPANGGDVLPFLQAGIPIQSEELDKIRELETPDDLRPTLDEAIDLLQQRQDLIQQASDRISSGEDQDTVIAELNPRITQLQNEARAKARELGLAVCGADDGGGGATTAGATTAGATTGGATGAAPVATDENTVYVDDVKEAAAALQGFGTTLQGTTSLEDLRSKAPEARAQLDDFDAAIAQLKGYTLDDATLDAQRSRLAETGPKVSDVLRRFVTAAGSGDTEAVQALVPEVTQAITDFQQAATATATTAP